MAFLSKMLRAQKAMLGGASPALFVIERRKKAKAAKAAKMQKSKNLQRRIAMTSNQPMIFNRFRKGI